MVLGRCFAVRAVGGSGFRVWGFQVSGSGVGGFRCTVSRFGDFEVMGFGPFQVWGSRFRAFRGSGFEVLEFRV